MGGTLKKLVLSALCAIFLLSRPAMADETGNTITWLHPIYPPVFMPKGPDKGTGILEQALPMLQQALPEYRHEVMETNMKRLLKTIEAGRFVCSNLLLKTPEREKFIAFSKPYILTHAYRIIVRAEDWQKFGRMTNQEGALSLAQLLETEGLRLGYSEGRSYSPPVNAVLKKQATKQNSYKSTNSDLLEALLKMTARKRVDYTIGYPFEVTYLARQMNLKQAFVSYAIAESADTYVAHVGCPNNAWGRKVIEAVNPVLERLRTDKKLYGAYMDWVDEPTGRQYENQVLRRFTGHATMAGGD